MEEIKFQEIENKLIVQQKNKSQLFDFLVAYGSNNQNKFFTNDYMGLAQVPIIGKYQKNAYELNQVKSLVVCECFCDQKSQKIYSTSNNPNESQIELGIPKEVKQILFNIPEKVKHNKKNEKIQNTENNQQKITNYLQKKSNIPDFHPFTFQSALNINVMWEISFQNPKINLNAKENFLNLVCHPYIFQEVNFETKKKMISNIAVCVVIPNKISQTTGIQQLQDTSKGVLFNQLRSEYLSCHLSYQALMLSPNNMKFELQNQNVEFIHFWTVILSELNFHHIFYFWNFMDNFKYKKQAEQLIKSSQNIAQLVSGFSQLLGEQHEAIKQIKEIFQSY